MARALFLLFSGFSLCSSAFAGQINFGIDCMIHDDRGILRKDLGMVGVLMDGSYMPSAEFQYGDLTIKARLQGPAASTPEVSSPDQLNLIIEKGGIVTAAVTAAVTPDTNIALWLPTANAYLHCNKMDM